MKNKLTQRVLASLIAIITVIGMNFPASAYVFTSYKHKNSTIYYYYDNWVGSRAISYFSTGASAWRAKTTEATVKHYSSSSKTGYDVYMCAGNVSGVTWDGLTQTTHNNSTKYVTSQTVTLNMSKPAWNDNNALKSVIVHEIGHVFGLADNGTTKTIMNGYTYGINSRYGGYGITTP